MKWFLLGFLILSACTKKSEGGDVATVTRGDVEVAVNLSGTIKPFRETVISAPYAGYIRKLYVKVGQTVKKGDPLVAFSANLSSAEEIFPIRAAYPGLISQVQKMEGDYATAAGREFTILKVEDISKLFIDTDIPEADIAKVKIGQKAKIRVNAYQDKEYDGEMVQIFQSARDAENNWDRKGGAFPARVRILNPGPELKTGLSAIVGIITMKRDKVLRVPQEFVMREQGQTVAIPKGRPNDRIPVKLGLRSDQFAEILEGLTEGAEVLLPAAVKASGDD